MVRSHFDSRDLLEPLKDFVEFRLHGAEVVAVAAAEGF